MNAGNQTQGSWVGKQVCQLFCNSAPVYNSFMVHCLDCTQIINIFSKIIIFLHSFLTHEAELKNRPINQKFESSTIKMKIKTAKSAMKFFFEHNFFGLLTRSRKTGFSGSARSKFGFGFLVLDSVSKREGIFLERKVRSGKFLDVFEVTLKYSFWFSYFVTRFLFQFKYLSRRKTTINCIIILYFTGLGANQVFYAVHEVLSP